MTVQISARTIAARGMDFGVSVDGPDFDELARFALCNGRHEEFDADFGPDDPRAQKLAAVCRVCPVFDLCEKRMSESDQDDIPAGFAAGKTFVERKAASLNSNMTARIEAIRPLHARGMNDIRIAEELGITRYQVKHAREVADPPMEGIPGGHGGARGRSKIERVR